MGMPKMQKGIFPNNNDVLVLPSENNIHYNPPNNCSAWSTCWSGRLRCAKLTCIRDNEPLHAVYAQS
jgi:hypothetical protein